MSDCLNNIRRKNFQRLAAEEADLERLARKLGYSPHYLAALRAGRKAMTARAARRIEARLRLPGYWLDEPHTDHALDPSRPVHRLRMQTAIEGLHELMDRGLELSLTEYLKALSAIYLASLTHPTADFISLDPRLSPVG
ncbi:MAG: hypothetical protein NW215_00430 [Hyphomicrobiales bacterium]|nr:hypothetical protein [Hyphomicrobiales bacterium]